MKTDKENTTTQLHKSNSQSKTGKQTETKKNPAKKEKKIIIKTIEDFKAKPTKETKINSPRSLAAMDITANNINELYQMTLKDFEEQFPETLKMTEEDKQKRYEKLESKRQEKIEEIITVRNEILQYEREEIEKYEQEQRRKYEQTSTEEPFEETKEMYTTQNYYTTQTKQNDENDKTQTKAKKTYKEQLDEEAEQHQKKKLEIIKQRNDVAVQYSVKTKLDENLREYTSNIYARKTAQTYNKSGIPTTTMKSPNKQTQTMSGKNSKEKVLQHNEKKNKER
jgi:hypothetical protein